jgi:hypothetical protein
MPEGELRALLNKEYKEVMDFFTKNPTAKKLLIDMYVTAGGWGNAKRIKFDDVQTEGLRMSPDVRVFWYQLYQSEESKAKNILLGPNGLPIGGSI